MAEFATRRCWIQGPGDAEPSELLISFFPPEERGAHPDDWWATAEVSCRHFTMQLSVAGGDGIHAVMLLVPVVHGFLQGRQKRYGYSIYSSEPGDLVELGWFWNDRDSPLDP